MPTSSSFATKVHGPAVSSRNVVLMGVIALAVAMGVGRFAFTPMLPLMLRDGGLNAAMGAEWAAVNYGGYLAGALSAAWFARRLHTGLVAGLLGVVVSTLAMAGSDPSLPWLGAVLRGVAGVCSAWVLVCASSWCLPELAPRGSRSGGWIYTGVGSGIAVTGALAWLGGRQTAQVLWIELGLLALVGTVYVLQQWRVETATTQSGGVATVATPPTLARETEGTWGLIVCYGVFGYGYIVPATFLPTMARELVEDPLVFGLTWPIFGSAAALSVAAAARWMAPWPRRKVWALAQATMAVGTLIPLLQQSLWALTLSAVLVGGTFMVATMAGLQLAREKMPANPTRLLSRMSVGFATGQIAGPVWVRLMGGMGMAQPVALWWANAMATFVLIVTALWLWRGEGLHAKEEGA